ncbi:hypothetical protein BU17DRAFT_97044 [Hysterangium stoloniferum]|nr:hypothetical protein BU17DRAFT_97044 [Hysterangium stoloniferum]
MDLSKAISGLGELTQVPWLQDAALIAINILKNVQVHKNNTAKLQQLALTIVGQLTQLSDQMRKRWDSAPDSLKEKLDVFVSILEAIQRVVEKQRKTPPLLSFLTASDRDTTIKELDARLKNAYGSIQMLLLIDNSMMIDHLDKMVEASHAINTDVRFVMQGLQSKKLNESPAEASYCKRTDFCLNRAIMRNSITMSSGGEVTIVLREATRQMSNETVLIKAYEGDAVSKQDLFKHDLKHAQAMSQDPAFLPIKEYSSAEVNIPFQVYESPDPAVHDEAYLKRLYERLVRSHTAVTSTSLKGEVGGVIIISAKVK